MYILYKGSIYSLKYIKVCYEKHNLMIKYNSHNTFEWCIFSFPHLIILNGFCGDTMLNNFNYRIDNEFLLILVPFCCIYS